MDQSIADSFTVINEFAQKQADRITALEATVAELQAWQAKLSADFADAPAPAPIDTPQS